MNERLIWDISKLSNWDQNPREIKEKGFENLKKQLLKAKEITGEYLFEPLLITPAGVVLGGNMRLRALKALGVKNIWVNIVDPKNEQDMMALALAANDRAGYYSAEDLLGWIEKYPDFKWGDYSVDLKEPVNLQVLIDRFAPINEDDAPAVAEGPAESKIGEVYLLGRHRLMCGDATKIEDVEKLMDGKKAELLFTSPPYADMRECGGDKELDVKHLSTFLPTFFTFVNYQVVNLGIKREKGEIMQYWNEYLKSAQNCGYKLLSWNIWDRGSATSIGMQSAMFPIFHEWLFVFGVNPKEINRTKPLSEESAKRLRYSPGTRRGADGVLKRIQKHQLEYDETKMGTVTSLKAVNTIGQSDHPAMFPVELPLDYIEAMTNEGDGVIDCFGGSGTTLIACEQTNRTCYMMELDPKYCDVIRKRYARLIDKEEEWKEITHTQI